MASKGRKRQRPRPWQTGEPPATPEPAAMRVRECRSKVAHHNRVAAEQAALEHERIHGDPKGVYRCRWCGKWHIGSQR